MALRDIAGQNLAATMSSLAISSATTSNRDAFPCQSGTVCSYCATAVNEMSKINQTTAKNPAVADCKISDARGATSDTTSITSLLSFLSSTTSMGYNDSEAVSAVLCLLHGLSHCSYHEPSLLVLVEHAAYDTAVGLFVYLLHRLQNSEQRDYETQACIFFLYYLLT